MLAGAQRLLFPTDKVLVTPVPVFLRSSRQPTSPVQTSHINPPPWPPKTLSDGIIVMSGGVDGSGGDGSDGNSDVWWW